MRVTFITLMFTLNIFNMDCVTVKSLEEAEKYLALHGKKLSDWEEQLPTNRATVYRISTGEVILLPSPLRPGYKCLLFSNEECFRECVRKDSFPVENEDKEMFEYDPEGQRKIHENIGKYHAYLNKRLKLDYPSLDRSNMQAYYEGVYKIKKKERMDIVALGAVMGELFRKELNGRWILEKWYGTYNPYYKPLIVHSSNDRIMSPYDKLVGMFKWKEKDASDFFFILPMTGGMTLDVFREAKREIIELQ